MLIPNILNADSNGEAVVDSRCKMAFGTIARLRVCRQHSSRQGKTKFGLQVHSNSNGKPFIQAAWWKRGRQASPNASGRWTGPEVSNACHLLQQRTNSRGKSQWGADDNDHQRALNMCWRQKMGFQGLFLLKHQKTITLPRRVALCASLRLNFHK